MPRLWPCFSVTVESSTPRPPWRRSALSHETAPPATDANTLFILLICRFIIFIFFIIPVVYDSLVLVLLVFIRFIQFIAVVLVVLGLILIVSVAKAAATPTETCVPWSCCRYCCASSSTSSTAAYLSAAASRTRTSAAPELRSSTRRACGARDPRFPVRPSHSRTGYATV